MSGVELLYRLQLVDSEHTDETEQLRLMRAALGETAELLASRQQVENVAAELAHWRGRLRDTELQLDGLTVKIKETTERLYGGEVTNPKELSNLHQDLEYLKRRSSGLEDEALEALAAVEEQEALLAQMEGLLHQVTEDWGRGQDELGRAVQKAEERQCHLEEQRRAFRSTADRHELALYDEMSRKKSGRAIASLENGMCAGCRVSVPNRLAERARSGDLITCVSCGRILRPKQ